MLSDRVRRRLVYQIRRRDDDGKVDTIVELFKLLKEEVKDETKEEIAETIAEMLFPDGIARIAFVIHPNGLIS
jgi:hypothetical protein